MRCIHLIDCKEQEDGLIAKLLEVNSASLKIYIIAKELPLISNLSVIENIVLPASYHKNARLKDYIEEALRYLEGFGLADKVHKRRDDLDEFEQMLVKYISCKIVEVKNIVFMTPMKFIAPEKFEDFKRFLKNCDENYLIIDYNKFYNEYNDIDKLNIMGFDEWLIHALKG